jgi:hypothetical protein
MPEEEENHENKKSDSNSCIITADKRIVTNHFLLLSIASRTPVCFFLMGFFNMV